MKKPITHVNLEELENILRIGVRRAVIFMGFGMNTPSIRPRIPYILPTKDIEIHLTPYSIDENQHDYLLNRYADWVVINGLRDLIEVFATFTHTLYTCIFLIFQHSKNRKKTLLRDPGKIEKLGVSDQILEISKYIKIDDRLPIMITSLNRTRNCLAHRHGVIGETDLLSGSDEFIISWLFWRPFVTRKNLETYEPEIITGLILKEGESLGVRIRETQRKFRLGDRIKIQNQDLKEIGLSLNFFGSQLIKEVESLAISSGITVLSAQEEEKDS